MGNFCEDRLGETRLNLVWHVLRFLDVVESSLALRRSAFNPLLRRRSEPP